MKTKLHHDPMAAQRDADLYNKSLPRWPKISKAEKAEPMKEPRKGRTADPDDPRNSRAPMVFGLEMGVASLPIRIAPEYKHETGPAPEWESPAGYQKQPHQRPGRIVSDDLKLETD